MKVAHIITGLAPHGAQMMLYKLLSRMDRERFEPVVISLTDRGVLGDKIESLNVPVQVVSMKSSVPTPVSLWRLKRLIRRIRPGLIQGWMYHGNLAAQVAGAFASDRIPIGWNIRGSSYLLRNEKPMTAATIWLGARLSGLPERIINNSTVSAIEHEKRLGYRADRRIIIPNGFDTTQFAPCPKARTLFRTELGVSEDALLIGLIARYHPMKDHANFLRAASILLEAYPSLHFILVGEGVDFYNHELRKLIKNFGLSTRTHLLGERRDLPYINAALDISSSSSSFGEGFPNVIGEAMSCGVPCVVTEVGDSGWVVGETGRVVSPQNPSALAGGWRDLLEMGNERRREMGTRARQRVIENFSMDAIARQYEKLYEQVIPARGIA